MKRIMLLLMGAACFVFGTVVFAGAAGGGDSATGIGSVAAQVTSNLGNIARLITAVSYVAGMAFAIAAIAKFKNYKENPTQVQISTPIVFLALATLLLFLPSLFKASGSTLFGQSGKTGGVSGFVSFGGS